MYTNSNFTLKLRAEPRIETKLKEAVIQHELRKLANTNNGLSFVENIKNDGFDLYIQRALNSRLELNDFVDPALYSDDESDPEFV